MPKSERKNRKGKHERRLRFHSLGAARMVTGSLHFFEVSDGDKIVRFCCDFGLDQENPGRNYQNRLPSGLRMKDVDFMIVSHPHLDHVGAIPKAVKDGFRGKIYATAAACDLSGVLLPDSGFLQEEEAKRRTRRNARRCQDAAHDNRQVSGCDEDDITIEPLYTREDAVACLSQFVPVEFDKPLKIADGFVVTFVPNPHLLGAAVVKLELGTGAKKRRVTFTGDLGPPDMPVLKELSAVKHADYLICEGTYGTKRHPKRDRQAALAEVINRAYERALKVDPVTGCGIIIIPAFAIGRVQSVLFDLKQLIKAKKIPNLAVFVDSPMAIQATAIYRRYRELYNPKASKLLASGGDLFSPPRFAELVDWQDSVKLDAPAKEPIIVVGSSGMAAGGRIVRHLENRLSGKNNTVIFIGYQSHGTLGRHLTTPGITEAKIYGKTIPVRATIEHMGDYSGHADCDDIVAWLKKFDTKPRKMFLVHGEEQALLDLKKYIEEKLHWGDVVEVPRLRQTFDLD